MGEDEGQASQLTPNPEQLCASAALTSTQPAATSETLEKLDLAKARSADTHAHNIEKIKKQFANLSS